MLEATLLKVRHSIKAWDTYMEEARKLLPYIKGCDAFAPETRLASTTLAQSQIKNWKRILRGSRTGLFKSIDYVARGSEEEDYVAKILDYMFRDRKPLIYLERWPEKDSTELKRQQSEYDSYSIDAQENLLNGNISRFLTLSTKSFQILVDLIKARDEHIGANVSLAESMLREEYPHLAPQEPMRLSFCLGMLHRPDRYVKIPITVVDLYQQSPIIEVSKRLVSGDPSPRDLLVWGLEFFARNRRVSLSEEAIKSYGFEELVDIAGTIR
jgi:hypothetical protein